MRIYKLTQDIENFKFFVYTDDTDSSITLDFIGQSLAENWDTIKFEIFIDKRKKNDSRSEEFDFSSYYDGILLANDNAKRVLNEIIGSDIELLPVITNKGNFSFVNLTKCINSINGIENMSYDDIMEMTRVNNYPFHKDSIGSNIIFRDSKLLTEYFVTEKFVNLVKDKNLKGLYFDFAGNAT